MKRVSGERSRSWTRVAVVFVLVAAAAIEEVPGG